MRYYLLLLPVTPHPHSLRAFWLGNGTFELSHVHRWKHGFAGFWAEEAKRNAGALSPLLLWAPDMLYPDSRRPRTNMAAYRFPGSLRVRKTEIEQTFQLDRQVYSWMPPVVASNKVAPGPLLIPVTRYDPVTEPVSHVYSVDNRVGDAVSNKVGDGVRNTVDDSVYDGVTGDAVKNPGTYYLEPTSTTYLSVNRYLVAPNRTHAVHQLEVALGRPISPLFDILSTGPNPDEMFEHPWMSAVQRQQLYADTQAFRERRGPRPDTRAYFPQSQVLLSFI